MDDKKLKEIHKQVKSELESCLRFWMVHGKDPVHDGVYTCLDKTGKVYSTDKSVWMQGRCGWLFSRLCNQYGIQHEWQSFAQSCLTFLENHCINREKENRMYFTVTAEGRPLRQRRYCFSEAFYTIANAEYYGLAGEAVYIERAREYYERIWQLNNGLMDDPTGLGPKTIPKTRQGRSLADSMIYLNISMVMREHDPVNQEHYLHRARECANIILALHHKPELHATLETVGMDGEFWSDVSAGRIVNPGHDMECAWFLLEYAAAAGDTAVAKKAEEMFRFAHQNGWDKQYGGLLYYTDVLGKPPEAYEHDMKLWWPHNELLIAALMLYTRTANKEYLDIFMQAWQYVMNVFNDPVQGEWYGYLRRDGKPTEPPAKGSTFKGPFHLPRMLIMLDGMLEKLLGD